MIKENETIVNKDMLIQLLEKADNFNKIEYALEKMGISIMENGNIRSTVDILQDLSEKWHTF